MQRPFVRPACRVVVSADGITGAHIQMLEGRFQYSTEPSGDFDETSEGALVTRGSAV